MKAVCQSIRRVAKAAWWWLRQVSGDAAYDNYRLYVRSVDGEPRRVLSREAFYIELLRSRYNHPSRCC